MSREKSILYLSLPKDELAEYKRICNEEAISMHQPIRAFMKKFIKENVEG